MGLTVEAMDDALSPPPGPAAPSNRTAPGKDKGPAAPQAPASATYQPAESKSALAQSIPTGDKSKSRA